MGHRQLAYVAASGARRSRGDILQGGMCFFMNTVSIPSGCTRLSAADNRAIVCAGDTYSAGETDGSATGFEIDSDLSGSHSGATFSAAIPEDYSGGTSYYTAGGTYASGNHQHTINFDYTPPYQSLVLVMVNSILTEFPADAIVMTHTSTSPTGLTRVYDSGKLAYCLSTIGTGGDSISINSVSTSGNHIHTGTVNPSKYGTVSSHFVTSAGDHTHTFTSPSASWSIKTAALAAWSKTSAFGIESDMICFYNNINPPLGWAVCNGSGGTPNLLNYFIELAATSDEGTLSGTNTLTLSGSLDTYSGNHTHDYGSGALTITPAATIYHTSQSWSHSHTTENAISAVMKYYGLVPIIKL